MVKLPCTLVVAVVVASNVVSIHAASPPFTDYCERLAHGIQGRKHGFLAGNVTYYVGGFHASWQLKEHETLGLTHPFHHDLRSRGVGLLPSKIQGSEDTGVGNDYSGWEFYKDTRVLYGSVIIGDKVHRHPRPTRMIWRPDKMICEYEIAGVQLREEKFIAANDAAASIITSSQPITLRFDGHSFFVRESVKSTVIAEFNAEANAIVITEGGTVRSRPDPDQPARVGPCVYQDMTTVLAASRDISQTCRIEDGDRGEKKYEFEVACDADGVVVAWAMHDERQVAIRSARETVDNAPKMLVAKSALMNRLLNGQIPWFRCSDKKFEDIYYYLWSLQLMYYIDVQQGWEMENHTQTAVNNFLGMHRYDAMFQIKVGAWTADKTRFAYGNVLTWKHLVQEDRYRELPNGAIALSDNKGIAWHSGAYGLETSEHVRGAWQIYQHTGDVQFLRDCYEGHFRKLFWKRVPGFFMNEFEVAEILIHMAKLTGHEEDVEHWQSLVRLDPGHIRLMFDQRWESNDHANYFAGPKNGMLMTTGFWPMRTRYFPREYAEQMVKKWAWDREDGFFGQFFPLAMSRQSMKRFATRVDHSFGYTPDTAYFTLDGMFRQQLADPAWQLTLNHIANYNYHDEWQIPVAPEAYDRAGKLFGDQYSNFNAGKILLYLEGLAGIEYSIPDNSFVVRDTLPQDWKWMEVRVPMQIPGEEGTTWTRVRYERSSSADRTTTKSIRVSDCPLRVTLEPWLEGCMLIADPATQGEIVKQADLPKVERKRFRFGAVTTDAAVTLQLAN